MFISGTNIIWRCNFFWLERLSEIQCKYEGNLSLCPTDLQASDSFQHYSITDKAMDYRILQMDEDQDRMYVGCKDHVLTMDINNITHGTLKVSMCSFLWSVIVICAQFCIFQTVASLFSLAASKEKIKCLFNLTACETHDGPAAAEIILIAPMICKWCYIWFDQNTFRVVQKSH